MTRALARLNDGWRREAEAGGRVHVPIRIGIGLNTADCLVGNMGSDQRFNYSALGEGVNLASRLEGQCKIYGVDIAISETTLVAAGEVAALEIDVVQVKGSSRPLKVFTLLGDEETARQAWYTDLAAEHAGMMAAYRRQDWADAEAGLARCRDLAPPGLDTLYDLYGRRIAAFAADPPAAAWAGVTVADRK
jgi:adenylate cyclase